METIEPIYKGAQTAQRHLVELTRHQFTIREEVQEKRKDGLEIQKTDQKSGNPKKENGRFNPIQVRKQEFHKSSTNHNQMH